MAFVFNADEIFKMAEQIERNGGAFYRLAAEQFSSQCQVFLTLAEQEDQHCATFSALRRQLASKDQEAAAYDPGQEAEAYLRAMADGRVFDIRRSPREILKNAKTLDDVIRIAIGLEKDSIVFYNGMQKMVPIHLGKDSLDLIILEELKHIVFLNTAWPPSNFPPIA